MSVLFGVFGLNFFLSVLLPLSVIAFAIAFIRSRQRDEMDLGTGLSAYVSIMIAVSAVLMAVGFGFLLTAITGGIDEDYTYGAGTNIFAPTAETLAPDDRAAQDLGRGIGLLLVGTVLALVHVLVRSRVVNSGHFDEAVECAVEVVMAIVAGIAVLVVASVGVSQALERAFVNESTASPGGALAFAWALIALWLFYGWRVLAALDISLSGPSRQLAEPD